MIVTPDLLPGGLVFLHRRDEHGRRESFTSANLDKGRGTWAMGSTVDAEVPKKRVGLTYIYIMRRSWRYGPTGTQELI